MTPATQTQPAGVLVIFGGLPGVGKSTLARALAERLRAVYLRIDSIEAGIRASALAPADLMDAGYAATGAGPDWSAVQARHYEPWRSATLRIDTAVEQGERALERLSAAAQNLRRP